MTPEQKEIMALVVKHGTITKKQVVEALGKDYYCNGEQHVGDRLSRMVKSNLLVRVKPGVFEIGTGKKSKPSTLDKGQQNLFQ